MLYSFVSIRFCYIHISTIYIVIKNTTNKMLNRCPINMKSKTTHYSASTVPISLQIVGAERRVRPPCTNEAK